MSKYFKHTLVEIFNHKGFEIICIMTQSLIHGYSDHGHYNIVFMNNRTGDIIDSNHSTCEAPAKILSLDEKIQNFKEGTHNLIDNLYQGPEEPARDLRDFWKFVTEANWKSDHDYKRIRKMFESDEQRESLRQDYQYLLEELYQKFYDDWLGNDGNGGIQASDDGWWDLRADVIGRGKLFYESITREKLQEMAKNYDYKENFGYSFNN